MDHNPISKSASEVASLSVIVQRIADDSCDCSTVSMEPKQHAGGCRYKMLTFAANCLKECHTARQKDAETIAELKEQCNHMHKIYELGDLHEQIASLTKQVEEWRFKFEQLADDALCALSSVTCTPEETYKNAPHCLKGDIQRVVIELKSARVKLTHARQDQRRAAIDQAKGVE